ncbi:DUF6090 family protein [Robiginitalea sp. SC105]|uniref:DUF6090 family protein n=1 Tax=Robiginitalea sp. SC105 TaxID=2762332 RepID=UPI001639DFA7|nr:DUF6090 family protein [Robiginitalea sp. SC105]MBC2840352.1 hypothetical protein [Robiginitalea sp. SC105]
MTSGTEENKRAFGLTLLRRLRRRLLAENNMGRYLVYAVGEIFLVVVGILIALQINNWNDERKERKEEQISYGNIRQQLLDDRKELVKVKDFNSYYSEVYKYASKIISSGDRVKTDSLAYFAMMLSQFSDFHRSGTIYVTLASSGELKILKNTEITSAIQQLETTYNFANQLETMHWELITDEVSPELKGVINYTDFEVIKPERLYGVELQNIFFEIIGLSSWKDSVYSQALSEIDRVIGLIDEELNGRE